MVKRLRHRPFTAVTGVQIPLESLIYENRLTNIAVSAIIYLLRRSSQVVRQWSATPVSTGSNPVCASYVNSKNIRVLFLYNRKLHFLLYKKPPAGCALRRTMMMSQATAAGARMCQGTFFVLDYNIYNLLTGGMISMRCKNKSEFLLMR